MKSLQEKLDGDVPPEVEHWIVEFHTSFDEKDLTPLQAVQMAMTELKTGHGWTVTHIRSGLMWSVCLGQAEVFEIEVYEP